MDISTLPYYRMLQCLSGLLLCYRTIPSLSAQVCSIAFYENDRLLYSFDVIPNGFVISHGGNQPERHSALVTGGTSFIQFKPTTSVHSPCMCLFLEKTFPVQFNFLNKFSLLSFLSSFLWDVLQNKSMFSKLYTHIKKVNLLFSLHFSVPRSCT